MCWLLQDFRFSNSDYSRTACVTVCHYIRRTLGLHISTFPWKENNALYSVNQFKTMQFIKVALTIFVVEAGIQNRSFPQTRWLQLVGTCAAMCIPATPYVFCHMWCHQGYGHRDFLNVFWMGLYNLLLWYISFPLLAGIFFIFHNICDTY